MRVVKEVRYLENPMTLCRNTCACLSRSPENARNGPASIKGTLSITQPCVYEDGTGQLRPPDEGYKATDAHLRMCAMIEE